MSYEIIKMREGTWRIENNGVRFFVLEGSERSLLIDSGMSVPDAGQLARSLTGKPLALLCTHADPDHISGNDAFDTVYMHPSEFAFYHHAGSHAHSMAGVWEGDIIDLGERKLEIIALPGHTPGSIAVLDRRERVLISGDPIQRNGRIFMFGPQRDLDAYLQSLLHLRRWDGAYDEIWPSHADIPVSPAIVEELIQKTRLLLSREIPGVADCSGRVKRATPEPGEKGQIQPERKGRCP